MIRCVEQDKGERWADFRERHGDSGRDLVLYLGRRVSGLKLKELAAAMGIRDYAVVAMGIWHYAKRLERSASDRTELQQAFQFLNLKI